MQTETALNKELLTEEGLEELYAYGFAQYNGGNWSESANIFRLLCTKKPLEARFWFGLAAALQEALLYSEALHCWAMVALLRENDPTGHFHAAECYFSLNEPEEGLKALRRADLEAGEKPCPLKEKIKLLQEQWKI